MLQSAIDASYCVYPRGGSIDELVRLVWQQNCNTTHVHALLDRTYTSGERFLLRSALPSSTWCVQPSGSSLSSYSLLTWSSSCGTSDLALQFVAVAVAQLPLPPPFVVCCMK